MTQGWHGDSEGHARAGRLGGKKSAQNRQRQAKGKTVRFGEQVPKRQPPQAASPEINEPEASPG